MTIHADNLPPLEFTTAVPAIQQELVLHRPRTERVFATGYPQGSVLQCSHPWAVEVCHGDAKRVTCESCGEWLVEFGTHRDGVIA